MCVALILNLGFVALLTFDSKDPATSVERPTRSPPGLQVTHAFLITAPEPRVDDRQPAPNVSLSLRKIHLALPPLVLRLDIGQPTTGDTIWSTVVATAITTVSAQSERDRLRSVYREQIRFYLAQRLQYPASQQSDVCTVRLRQDTNGEILEATVTSCRGGPDWQSEVLARIRRATPLPAAPRPDIFQSQFLVDIGKTIDIQM